MPTWRNQNIENLTLLTHKLFQILKKMSYLKNPAAMRKLMNRVKPAQTPPRPKVEGAYSKNKEDIAPTTIYTTSKIMWFINEILWIKTQLSDKVPESQKYIIP